MNRSLKPSLKVFLHTECLKLSRKSTVGFNIGQMILDLAGGILSLAQLALEAIVLKDSTIVTGASLSTTSSTLCCVKCQGTAWNVLQQDLRLERVDKIWPQLWLCQLLLVSGILFSGLEEVQSFDRIWSEALIGLKVGESFCWLQEILWSSSWDCSVWSMTHSSFISTMFSTEIQSPGSLHLL